MFCNPLKESTKNEVEIKNVKGDILKQLIDYCYTGFISINNLNAQSLIEAATEFQFNDIVKVGCEYLIAQLDVDNCIGIHIFAEYYNLKDLNNLAIQTICKNFPKLSDGEEFRAILPFAKFKKILSMNNLQITSEEEVFESIMTWVSHNADRKIFIPSLMQHVRLTQLSSTVSLTFKTTQ